MEHLDPCQRCDGERCLNCGACPDCESLKDLVHKICEECHENGECEEADCKWPEVDEDE